MLCLVKTSLSEELRDTVENPSDNIKTPPLWQDDGEKNPETEAPVVEEEPEEGEISD